MRASNLLKENIDALLKAHHQHRKDLAQWCYRGESWISKIFKHANREIPLKYLDRIADFWGLKPYQLFQPGIARSTERRQLQRRSAVERRVGQRERIMLEVKADVDRVRSPKAEGHEEDRRTPSLPDPLRASIIATVARLNDLLGAADARGQTPRARQPKPAARRRRRVDRGSDAPKTDG